MSATFLFPDSKDFSPDFKEVARYLGYRRATPPEADVSALMEKAASEMQAVFEIFDLTIKSSASTDCRVSFADVTLHSRDLGVNLKDCSQVALLAATIGPLQ